jgi:transmembrane sensor
MTHDTETATSIAEQAAHWWVVFHGEGASAAEHREFAEWVARSPERVEAYLHIARLHSAFKSSAVHWPDTSVAELICKAKAAPADTLPLPVGSVQRQLSSEKSNTAVRIVWSMAAALVLVIGLSWLALTRPEHYQTRFGEQRSILLEDGSRVTLNTASKIEVRLQQAQRVVRLIEGEALFEVAHDAARPFDVVAGDAVLRAVGTQFDVDLRPHGTVVTIVEGIVTWAPRTSTSSNGAPREPLAARDRLVISGMGAGTLQHGANTNATTSWTRNQLIFEHRPLGEVVEEFNRYNREQIEVSAAELRSKEITGVFQSNDAASFLAFLSDIPGVRVRRNDNGTHQVDLGQKPRVQ